MGDTPTDPTQTLQQGTQAAKDADQAVQSLNLDISDFINRLGQTGSKASEVFLSLKNNVIDVMRNVDNFKVGLTDIGKEFIDGSNELDKFSNAYFSLAKFSKTTDFFAGLGHSDRAFSDINTNIKAMGSNWQDVISKISGALPRAIQNLSKDTLDNISKGQQAQMQMVQSLGAGGNLGTFFDPKTGEMLGDLSKKTLEYTASLGEVARANGLTVQQTIRYSDTINKIPGILSQTSKLTGESGAEVGILTGALKLASGSGQDFNRVMSTLETAYQNLGNAQGRVIDSGDKGLKLFATMSEISKTLNIQFGEAEGFLKRVADSFKFVGDNTKGATEVLSRFMGALRETGLTSNASISIINGMVDAVGKLNIGTRAFLSARTGGPGGLQGAFQIENMLRQQDGVARVMGLVEKNLRQQFGGKIFTLQEAAQSPQAASQFMRQRSLLQSGAFGELVGKGPEGDAKANRLLEALARGDRGGAENVIKTGQDALTQVANQGNSMQEQTNTFLNQIATSSEEIALSTQVMAASFAKQFLGDGANQIEDLKKAMTIAAEQTGSTSKQNAQTGLFNDGRTLDITASNILGSAGRRTIQSGKQLISGIGEGAHEDIKRVGGGIEAIGNVAQQVRIRSNEERIRKGVVPLSNPANRNMAQLRENAITNIPTTTAVRAANITQNQNISVKNDVNIKVDLTDAAKEILSSPQVSQSSSMTQDPNIINSQPRPSNGR